jgi:hypothetical protein
MCSPCSCTVTCASSLHLSLASLIYVTRTLAFIDITHSLSLSLSGLARPSLVCSLITPSRAQGVDAMARDEMLRLWGELQAAPSTSSGGLLRAECHKPAVYDMIYGQNMVDLATGVLGSDTFKLYPGFVAPPPFAKKRPCSTVLHHVPLCYTRVSGRVSSPSTICGNSGVIVNIVLWLPTRCFRINVSMEHMLPRKATCVLHLLKFAFNCAHMLSRDVHTRLRVYKHTRPQVLPRHAAKRVIGGRGGIRV